MGGGGEAAGAREIQECGIVSFNPLPESGRKCVSRGIMTIILRNPFGGGIWREHFSNVLFSLGNSLSPVEP